MQGVYYYRNHRLIKYGGWEGLFEKQVTNTQSWGKSRLTSPARFIVTLGSIQTRPVSTFRVILPCDCNESPMKNGSGGKSRGEKKTFTSAAQHRYDNEGKKANSAGNKKRRQNPQPPHLTLVSETADLQSMLLLLQQKKRRRSQSRS